MTVLTNEQAINKLQDILEQYWKLDKKYFVMDFNTAEAMKMGIQALDNQRPVLDELEENKDIKAKPIFLKSEDKMIPRCPRCYHALLLRQDEHECSECGKEIDWS